MKQSTAWPCRPTHGSLRSVRPVSGGEGAAAAATASGVGIDENESLAHQRLFVIERRTVEVQKALGIDEDAGAKLLKYLVTVTRLGIEAHGVGKTGAAAALNSDPQSALGRRNAFLGQQSQDLLRRALRDAHLGPCRIGDLSGHAVQSLPRAGRRARSCAFLPPKPALPLNERASRKRPLPCCAWSSSCRWRP